MSLSSTRSHPATLSPSPSLSEFLPSSNSFCYPFSLPALASLKINDRVDSLSHFLLLLSRRQVWILFSTRPLTMALRKGFFRGLVAVAGAAYAGQCAMGIDSLITVAALRACRYRITPLVLRDGSPWPSDAAVAGVAAVGMLRSGCRVVEPMVANYSGPGAAVTIAFGQAVTADGVWIMTGAGPPERDPGRFLFEASADGVEWRTVLSPPWLNADRLWLLPAARGAVATIDLRPPVMWTINQCVGCPWMVFCIFACLAFGLLGRGSTGARALMWGYAGLSLTQFGWALRLFAAWIADGAGAGSGSVYADPLVMGAAWVFCMCSALLAVTLHTERYALDAFHFVFSVTAVVATPIVIRDGSSPGITLRVVATLAWTAVPAAVITGLFIARYLTCRWVADRLLAADRQAYDAIWKQTMKADEINGALDRLARVCEDINSGLDPSRARQRRPLQPGGSCSVDLPLRGGGGNGGGCHDFSEVLSCGRQWGLPLTSLDQLMDQALCLNIFLKGKCRALAMTCRGALPAAAASDAKAAELGGSRGALLEFLHPSAAGSSVRWSWAVVKPAERAVEKLLRSYDCDTSRLLDCCRQTIVFDSVVDLLACVEAVREDPEMEVVQFKNRLDDRIDSRRFGGFRYGNRQEKEQSSQLLVLYYL